MDIDSLITDIVDQFTENLYSCTYLNKHEYREFMIKSRGKIVIDNKMYNIKTNKLHDSYQISIDIPYY
jgi:hypothetical protein